MSITDQALREAREVELLTGNEAGDMLSAALASAGIVRSWKVHSVHHRPGAGVTVGYTVQIEGPRTSDVLVPGGNLADEYICATTGRVSQPPSDVLVRIDGPQGIVAHVWRHPNDPELPALKTACESGAMSRLVGQRVKLELLSYRPTRRGVLRVNFPDRTRAYAKVVRPAHAHSLVKRHNMLVNAGIPAPRVLQNTPDGLVLISSGEGEPLANLLSRGMGQNTEKVLNTLLDLLEKLPAEAANLTRRPAWSERADHYGNAASTVLPQHRARIELLTNGVNYLMANSDPGPVVATHGDFYEANILMDGRNHAVSSLIDVDSLGPGYRVDDLGCLLGHISVLPYLAPHAYPHVPFELEEWTRICEQRVDPVALVARCAGVTLSLIAGARREDGREWLSDAEGRLAAAEQWVARGYGHLARRNRIAANPPR
ncbi:MAG: phosphotransferase [Flaviflexus sp.]|uniref:phosphotransferase n=1 Tax=Flaviflexus sp. TaxID=1969482 RepID=UPI00352F2AAB